MNAKMKERREEFFFVFTKKENIQKTENQRDVKMKKKKYEDECKDIKEKLRRSESRKRKR